MFRLGDCMIHTAAKISASVESKCFHSRPPLKQRPSDMKITSQKFTEFLQQEFLKETVLDQALQADLASPNLQGKRLTSLPVLRLAWLMDGEHMAMVPHPAVTGTPRETLGMDRTSASKTEEKYSAICTFLP